MSFGRNCKKTTGIMAMTAVSHGHKLRLRVKNCILETDFYI